MVALQLLYFFQNMNIGISRSSKLENRATIRIDQYQPFSKEFHTEINLQQLFVTFDRA